MFGIHSRWPRLGARALALIVLMAGLLGACAAEEDEEEKKTLTVSWVGNTTTLASGRAMVALHIALTSCDGGATSSIRHTADKDITVAGGPVDVKFTLSSKKYPKAYAEAYYVDVDNSNTLTNGDVVWGSDPNDFSGFCFNGISTRPSQETVSWEDAVDILGSTVWSGGAQSYGAGDSDDEGEPEHLPFTMVPLERSYSELIR